MLSLYAPSPRTIVFALLLVLIPATLSHAQSVSEILNKADEKAEEINRVLKALQNSDKNTQYALVEALLKEKDKALLRVGREHALFSTNPVLQNMAIESVFNTNPQVRLVLTEGDSPEALRWVEYVGGVSDGRSGMVMLETGTHNGSCWLQPIFGNCRFTVLGNTVQFANQANGGQAVMRAQASLTLGPDGVLDGLILSSSGRARVSIDLKE